MQRKDADGVVKDHAAYGKNFQLFVAHVILLNFRPEANFKESIQAISYKQLDKNLTVFLRFHVSTPGFPACPLKFPAGRATIKKS